MRLHSGLQISRNHAGSVDLTSALCASSRMSSPLWNCCSLTWATQWCCCRAFPKSFYLQSQQDANRQWLRTWKCYVVASISSKLAGSVDLTSPLGAQSRMSSPLWNCCSQEWLIHWFSSRAASQLPAFFRFYRRIVCSPWRTPLQVRRVDFHCQP